MVSSGTGHFANQASIALDRTCVLSCCAPVAPSSDKARLVRRTTHLYAMSSHRPPLVRPNVGCHVAFAEVVPIVVVNLSTTLAIEVSSDKPGGLPGTRSDRGPWRSMSHPTGLSLPGSRKRSRRRWRSRSHPTRPSLQGSRSDRICCPRLRSWSFVAF
jgi:hypothetical protein